MKECCSFGIGKLFWTLFGKGQDPRVSSHSDFFPVFTWAEHCYNFWHPAFPRVSCRHPPSTVLSCNAGGAPRHRFDPRHRFPGLGRPPWRRHGNPLQYSCLEDLMDRGAWRATVHGVAKSPTQLKQLSTHSLTLLSPRMK